MWMRRTEVFASLAAALCLAAPLAQAQTPQKGGTAIVVLAQDPPHVNPNITSGYINHLLGCMIYQGLVEVAADYSIKPLIAKSWTVSPDGLTYSFELNKTSFQDGSPVTAEDVKYSLTEVSAKFSPTFAPAGRELDSVEAPAPDKVVIKLKKPFAPFLVSMTCSQGAAILQPAQFRGTNIPQNPANMEGPIGTGAFKLVEWKRGDTMRLVKSDKYWEPGKPYLDGITTKTITQASAALQALQAGEVDMVPLLQPSDFAAVRANPKLKIETGDVPPNTVFLMPNNKNKPLDDKRVRQAMFMATDRDYLMKNAFFNQGAVAVMPFAPDISWAANPEIDYNKMYPFDVAKANALLDEAGLKRGADGKRATFRMLNYGHEYPEYQLVAPALKSMWQAVGVDLQLSNLETATYLKQVFVDHDFDWTLSPYSSFSDPALGIARVFVTSSIAKPYGNATQYSNPEVDALFDKAQGAVTTEGRGQYYRQVQSILASDLPALTLRQYRNNDAASVRLKGLWGIIQGQGHWVDAYLAQ